MDNVPPFYGQAYEAKGSKREEERKGRDWQVHKARGDQTSTRRVIQRVAKIAERLPNRLAEQGKATSESGSGTEWLLDQRHQLDGAYLLGQQGIRMQAQKQRWQQVPVNRGARGEKRLRLRVEM